MIEDITEAIAEMLSGMLDRGFELPFMMATIAANGSFMVTAYMQDGDALQPEFLAERTVGSGFKTPVNIVVVDSRGEAARMVVDSRGGRTLVH